MQRKFSIKFFNVIFSFMLIFNLAGLGTVFAQERADISVSDVELGLSISSNGNPIEPGSEVSLYDPINVHYDIKIPDNVEIKSGDKITLTIPEELKINSAINFEIKDANGNVIGTAKADPTSGKIVVEFNDYFETHTVDKNISLDVWTNWDIGNVKPGENVDLDFDGETINVDLGEEGQIDPTEKLTKWGWVDENDPTLIHWAVRVNFEGTKIENAVFEDFIGENQELIPESIQANLGKYNGTDYEWIADVEGNKIILTDTGFKIEYGDLETSSNVFYDTRATDDGKSDKYYNKATLTGDGVNEEVEPSTPQSGGNGNGGGNTTEPTEPTEP
ncbi:collagen binding domain-containing protein, partial [Enterococcus faecalis]|uniref:collagen binding domain-containing protein n=1 Tax=Enterococcus faecalis TaxID=1351 RepID=UPI00046C8B29